jgi:hypothetical protein
MPMSRFRWAAAAAVFTLVQTAQALPLPERGLWEVRSKTLVNGQDVMAAARKNVEEQLQQMPPQERAQARAFMAQALAAMADLRQECLTARDTARYGNDPRAWLDDLQRDSPGCRYTLIENTATTLRYTGRCKAVNGEGFEGTVQGEMTMTSPRAWRATHTGQGRYTLPDASSLPGVDMSGPIRLEVQASGRWLRAQCATAKP